MTLPISVRAGDALFAQLQTITIANGYYTDIGNAMYQGRRGFTREQVPAGCIFRTSKIPGRGSVTDNNASFPGRTAFTVEAHGLASGDDFERWVGLACADIERCLMAWAAGIDGQPGRGVRDSDGRIGALVYYGADVVDQPAGAVSVAHACRFVVAAMEGFGDPTKPL